MTTTAPAAAEPKPSEGDLGRVIGGHVRVAIRAEATALERRQAETERRQADTERRLAEVERELISLRQLSAATGAGQRRQFVAVSPDPTQPGYSLLHLNDGSAVSVSDERLASLAGAQVQGRA